MFGTVRGSVVRFIYYRCTDTRRKLNAVIQEDVGYRIWGNEIYIYINSFVAYRCREILVEFLFGV